MATSSIQARTEMKIGESRTRDVIKSRIGMLDSSNDTATLAIVADTRTVFDPGFCKGRWVFAS
jgi:hypothetical protein